MVGTGGSGGPARARPTHLVHPSQASKQGAAGILKHPETPAVQALGKHLLHGSAEGVGVGGRGGAAQATGVGMVVVGGWCKPNCATVHNPFLQPHPS